jgi:ArsR family transcriptional regulator, arsenate/arsenite/antimonite-responsive transcriptional repressor
VDHNELATMCRALGDPTRARIVQFLLNCCSSVAVQEEGSVSPFNGVTAGEVCCHLTGDDKVSSTVSFHLKELRQAGLILMEKQGKYMICSANRDALAKLAAFFDTACKGQDHC